MYVLSLVLVFMFIQMFMLVIIVVIVVVITVMMAFFIIIGINLVVCFSFLYSRHIQMEGIYLLLMLLTVRMRALLSKAMRVPTGSAMQDEIHTNIY